MIALLEHVRMDLLQTIEILSVIPFEKIANETSGLNGLKISQI